MEMTQRLVSPASIPDHSAQPGVRESLMRVLVGRRIAVDIGSNDTCYYGVARTLLEKVFCRVHSARISEGRGGSRTTPERLSMIGQECGEMLWSRKNGHSVKQPEPISRMH